MINKFGINWYQLVSKIHQVLLVILYHICIIMILNWQFCVFLFLWFYHHTVQNHLVYLDPLTNKLRSYRFMSLRWTFAFNKKWWRTTPLSDSLICPISDKSWSLPFEWSPVRGFTLVGSSFNGLWSDHRLLALPMG